MGKLNSAKGYDLFGNAVTKILDKHDDWKAITIGNEPRQKLFYNHKNLINFGFKNNKYVLKKLEEVSIAIVPQDGMSHLADQVLKRQAEVAQ